MDELHEREHEEAPRAPVARMSPAEFRRLGLLQEVNRQFLHPRGLALEVIQGGGTGFYFRIERDGVVENRELSELTLEEIIGTIVAGYAPEQTAQLIHGLAQLATDRPERFGQVWDYRDDPEGLVFGEGLSEEAARYADELLEQHRPAREALLEGQVVEPVGFMLPLAPSVPEEDPRQDPAAAGGEA